MGRRSPTHECCIHIAFEPRGKSSLGTGELYEYQHQAMKAAAEAGTMRSAAMRSLSILRIVFFVVFFFFFFKCVNGLWVCPAPGIMRGRDVLLSLESCHAGLAGC